MTTPSKKLFIQLLTCKHTSDQRLSSALKQLEPIKGLYSINVLDGVTTETSQGDKVYDARLNAKLMKRPMSTVEIAVYESHREAWVNLLNSNYEETLILEDDFHIVDQKLFTDFLNNWTKCTKKIGNFIKLFDFEPKRVRKRVTSNEFSNIDLVKWVRPPASTVGYIINREAAENLLKQTRFFRPVDEDIKYFWEYGLNVWSTYPYLVVDGSSQLGGSSIEDSRVKSSKGRRWNDKVRGNYLTLKRKMLTRYHNRKYRV